LVSHGLVIIVTLLSSKHSQSSCDQTRDDHSCDHTTGDSSRFHKRNVGKKASNVSTFAFSTEIDQGGQGFFLTASWNSLGVVVLKTSLGSDAVFQITWTADKRLHTSKEEVATKGLAVVDKRLVFELVRRRRARDVSHVGAHSLGSIRHTFDSLAQVGLRAHNL